MQPLTAKQAIPGDDDIVTTTTTYSLPELGYAFDALEPAYSAELLELHYGKHHQAYVDAANRAVEALTLARDNEYFGNINELQRNLAFSVSGHLLHSIFWSNVAPTQVSALPEALDAEINRAFGSMDQFREQFMVAGKSIQGSGWAALSWEPLSRSLIVEQILDHHCNVAVSSSPLLVMDMWEHAFYLQYRNERHRWVKAFWDLVNWQDVERRLIDAQKVSLTMDLPFAGQE